MQNLIKCQELKSVFVCLCCCVVPNIFASHLDSWAFHECGQSPWILLTKCCFSLCFGGWRAQLGLDSEDIKQSSTGSVI